MLVQNLRLRNKLPAILQGITQNFNAYILFFSFQVWNKLSRNTPYNLFFAVSIQKDIIKFNLSHIIHKFEFEWMHLQLKK